MPSMPRKCCGQPSPRRLVARRRPRPGAPGTTGCPRGPGCRAGRSIGTNGGGPRRQASLRRLPGMTNVVIVDAVRTPVGRRGGGLSTVHPADLLATVQQSCRRPHRHRPGRGRPGRRRLRQPGRRAELQHHPHGVAGRRPAARHVPATTVDTQCGSSQQATNLATSLVGCGRGRRRRRLRRRGDEPHPDRRRARRKKLGLGVPIPKTYFGQYEMTSQFEGAERIADKWGITRDDTDAFGLASQQRAARAWAEDRFARQLVAGRRTGPRRGRQARPAPPTRSPATRACGRRRSRRWPSSSPSPARTACTPRARRRRSPTARPPCC